MTNHVAFCDPSGGSSDSFPLAIAHLSFLTKCAVLDGFWERKPPFSPDSVVEQFSVILREYRISQVTGDRYAGAWVSERFREHGIQYIASEKTKSEIYQEFLALANSHRVKIPRSKRLRVQLESLERRTSRTGRDSVDHPVGSHDDVANAVAGALVLASRYATQGFVSFSMSFPVTPPLAENRQPSFATDRRTSFDQGSSFRDEDGCLWHRMDS